MKIKSDRIVTERGIINGSFTVENGVITQITVNDETKADLDFTGHIVLPGIFDTHNHGTCGYSMMGEKGCEAEFESIVRGYQKGLASQGVTSILPTADFSMFQAIANVMKEENNGAKIIGIHSEGPYLNRVGEKGVDTGHPEIDLHHIQEMIDAAQGNLRLVALAPELEGSKAAIQLLNANGVRVAFAHSNCNYEEALEAFENGITVTTHTGNVMSGIHHRNMGGLGACLLKDDIYNEIICDGLHLRNEMIDMMFRIKHDAFHHFMMISDNICMAGLPAGRYTMPGFMELNIDENGFCLTDTGRLCGSARPVIYGMRNLVKNLHLPLEIVSRMASLNPCRVYGVGDHKGSIEIRKDADFIVMDDEFNCLKTYSEGRLVYDCETETNVLNQAFVDQYRIG